MLFLKCSIFVALFAAVWYVLKEFSEEIVSYFEVNGSGEKRREAFPAGKHLHPTPVLAPLKDAPELGWDHRLHTLPSGKKIWWQKIWPKDQTPKAIVAFVHGFADHADFMIYNVARAFAERTGSVALLVDMPGHGRSDGLHGLVPDWPQHLNALDNWCNAVCTAEQGKYVPGEKLPLFLFGSSMGGAVAIGLALRQPHRFAGMMLIAPMVKLSPSMQPPPHMKAILMALSQIPIVGDIPLHKGKDLASQNYNEDALWRLKEDKDLNSLHYWKDTRLRTAASVLAATDGIAKQMEALRTPLLVLHGENDKTTASELSEELVRRARAEDKTFKLVEGGMHGLHYGESPETMKMVYDTMFEWLKART